MKRRNILGFLLVISNSLYSMELDVLNPKKENKTLAQMEWPTVDEKAYIPTLDLSNRSLATLDGFAHHMPSRINGKIIHSLKVTHCFLSAVDTNKIISCVPNLEYLDVSHNNIVELLLAQKRLKRLIAHHNENLEKVILDPLPSEETDLSDNPSLTWITLEKRSNKNKTSVYDGDPKLRLVNTGMSDDRIEALQNFYAGEVYKREREMCVSMTGLSIGMISWLPIFLVPTIEGVLLDNISDPGTRVAAGLGYMVASGLVSSAIGGATYFVTKKTCCKRLIEQEKWEAQQKALCNIILEDSVSFDTYVELDGESYS